MKLLANVLTRTPQTALEAALKGGIGGMGLFLLGAAPIIIYKGFEGWLDEYTDSVLEKRKQDQTKN